MSTRIKDFVDLALLPFPVYPPTVPLRHENWAGLAFDCNRYPDLAPPKIWDALFQVHNECGSEKICIISADNLELGHHPDLIDANRETLVSYLWHDFRVAYVHYAFSQKHQWLCRLDQDTTLISGEGWIIHDVLDICGGREAVMRAMIDDLDPDSPVPAPLDDQFGMQRYLNEMTSEARLLGPRPNNSFKPKPLRGSA